MLSIPLRVVQNQNPCMCKHDLPPTFPHDSQGSEISDIAFKLKVIPHISIFVTGLGFSPLNRIFLFH